MRKHQQSLGSIQRLRLPAGDIEAFAFLWKYEKNLCGQIRSVEVKRTYSTKWSKCIDSGRRLSKTCLRRCSFSRSYNEEDSMSSGSQADSYETAVNPLLKSSYAEHICTLSTITTMCGHGSNFPVGAQLSKFRSARTTSRSHTRCRIFINIWILMTECDWSRMELSLSGR